MDAIGLCIVFGESTYRAKLAAAVETALHESVAHVDVCIAFHQASFLFSFHTHAAAVDITTLADVDSIVIIVITNVTIVDVHQGVFLDATNLAAAKHMALDYDGLASSLIDVHSSLLHLA